MIFRFLIPTTTVAAIALAAACSSDDTGIDAQIRQFCDGFFANAGFTCCSAADRADPNFVARYGFSSPADCSQKLLGVVGDGTRHGFDADAAQSCLSHLAGRGCGIATTIRVRQAAEAAGCDRVIGGVQAENQPCDTQSDCKPGLFCPPVKETGTSSCSKPGVANDSCFGDQANSVEHPTCGTNLICVKTGQNPAGCPTPPCDQFFCVPRGVEGDACTGVECGKDLTCRDGLCQKGGLSTVGAGCSATDQCADGLYCEPSNGLCAARKAAGAACRPSNNPLFECKGACAGSGDSGTCAAFCNSG